jgi:hypothetical protein
MLPVFVFEVGVFNCTKLAPFSKVNEALPVKDKSFSIVKVSPLLKTAVPLVTVQEQPCKLPKALPLPLIIIPSVAVGAPPTHEVPFQIFDCTVCVVVAIVEQLAGWAPVIVTIAVDPVLRYTVLAEVPGTYEIEPFASLYKVLATSELHV